MQIDRRKHEVDITERVLEGGIWTAGTGPLENGRVVEIEFARAQWALGTVDIAKPYAQLDVHKSRTFAVSNTAQTGNYFFDPTTFQETFDYTTNGATYMVPTGIVSPRFARFNMTVNF